MKKIAIIFSSVILSASCCLAQNSGNIVLNKGQKFNVETSSNVLITQDAMGQSMEIKTDLKTTNTIDVKEVSDNTYSLSNTITKMNMSMSMMGQDMSYDSEKKDDQTSDIGKNLSKVINKPMDVSIDKKGTVLNQKPATEKKDETSDMMMGVMQNLMGNVDDGSAGISLAFQNIPGKPAVGSTWSDSSTKEGNVSHTIYIIKELNGNEAKVGVKGDLSMVKKQEVNGMEITSNSKGTVTGESIIDVSTGVIKQKNTTLETTGTVEVMGQQMPMTTKVTSTTVVKPAQ